MTRPEHLLTIAAEECAEVAQRISKALRFTLEEVQHGQAFSNAERIMHEYADLVAMMELLIEEELVPLKPDFRRRIHDKQEKVQKLLEYSRKCGTLV